MGSFFRSFDEAWRFFLGREDDLEDFFAAFPAEETFALAWLLRVDDAHVPHVREVQRGFAHLDWITPQPDHFLHTSIAAVSTSSRRPTSAEIAVVVERARRSWTGCAAFDLVYRRVNCFHAAVVVEVAGDGPRGLVLRLVEGGYWSDLPIDGALGAVELELFLPHVTIAVVNEPSDPSPLREALGPLRDVAVGSQTIDEVALCVVPAARSTILAPWDVVATVRLD